ncbi:MAG: DedA family protein [Bacilli bacterium]
MQLIHHYGYIGLTGILVLGIVGLPLPDETILTAVGYFVYRGDLAYFPALLAGVAGGAIGITLSYLVGALLGRPLVLRFGRCLHITDKSLLRVERYLERYGSLTLFGGFFIPGVRHVTAIVAGLGGMTWARFALAAYAGVCVWVTAFITLGRFAGPQITRVTDNLPMPAVLSLLGVSLFLLLCSLIGWAAWRRRHKF